MTKDTSAQALSNDFHAIEDDIRALTIRLAECKARANKIALEAKLPAIKTQRLMNQLVAADQATNELTSRMALAHTAAEKIGEEVRSDFPWDCPDDAVNAEHTTVVSIAA